MIVASSLDLGKADSLVQLAEDLAGFVRQSVQEGASLDHLERGALRLVLEMGHAAVDLFLEAQGNGDLGDRVLTAEGAVMYRSATVLTRPLRTIFGEHSFAAYVYAQGNKRRIELRPIDARLNLPEGKASYLLQEFSQLFCVEKAFGVGARQFEKVFGQRLSVDVLEDINREMGQQAERFLDALPQLPHETEGELLVTTADGKGVPLVKQAAQQVPAFDEKERPGNRRMATRKLIREAFQCHLRGGAADAIQTAAAGHFGCDLDVDVFEEISSFSRRMMKGWKSSRAIFLGSPHWCSLSSGPTTITERPE